MEMKAYWKERKERRKKSGNTIWIPKRTTLKTFTKQIKPPYISWQNIARETNITAKKKNESKLNRHGNLNQFPRWTQLQRETKDDRSPLFSNLINATCTQDD